MKSNNFHDHLFDNVYVKSLVHGNMYYDQAVALKDSIDSILDFGILENAAAKTKHRIHKLDGPYAYVYHTFNEEENDSAIFNSYKVSYLVKDSYDGLKDFLCLEIISSLLSTYAYDYLRTEKLLGYIVSSGAFAIGKSGFLYVLIQGNKESPPVMDNEIEIVLRRFRDEELTKITEERLETIKQSIHQQLTSPDDSLGERTARIWKEIVERNQDFDLREKMIELLEDLKLEELVSIYSTKIAPEDISTVEKLSVQFYSPKVYPDLPKSFPNSLTPYKAVNKLNDELIEN